MSSTAFTHREGWILSFTIAIYTHRERRRFKCSIVWPHPCMGCECVRVCECAEMAVCVNKTFSVRHTIPFKKNECELERVARTAAMPYCVVVRLCCHYSESGSAHVPASITSIILHTSECATVDCCSVSVRAFWHFALTFQSLLPGQCSASLNIFCWSTHSRNLSQALSASTLSSPKVPKYSSEAGSQFENRKTFACFISIYFCIFFVYLILAQFLILIF